MKSSEFITEVSQDWSEKQAARKVIADIYEKMTDPKKKINPAHVPAFVAQAKAAIKISGRAFGSYNYGGNSGYMFDWIMQKANEIAHASGQFQLPTTGASISSFAKQVALFFKSYGARYTTKFGRVWMCSNGTKHKDAENFIVFDKEEDRDAAWEELGKKGKRIYISDALSPKSPQEYLQFGKILVSCSSSAAGYFGNKPEWEYKLAFQSSAIAKNDYYCVNDITDQQAATLRDIAATRNDNALAGIKAIMAVLKGEEEVKKVIANSQKINPNDKAKLDAIIAGAANFKEPQ